MESGLADLTWATGATLSLQMLHLQVTQMLFEQALVSIF